MLKAAGRRHTGPLGFWKEKLPGGDVQSDTVQETSGKTEMEPGSKDTPHKNTMDGWTLKSFVLMLSHFETFCIGFLGLITKKVGFWAQRHFGMLKTGEKSVSFKALTQCSSESEMYLARNPSQHGTIVTSNECILPDLVFHNMNQHSQWK